MTTRLRRAAAGAASALLIGALGIGSGTAAGAAKAKCSSKPFVGTVERAAESTSGSGQPAAARETDDFASAIVYDFGNRKNYTVYVGDYEVDPDDLGSTIEAPAGNVLVTVFLRNTKGTALKPGSTLSAGKDPISVIVDAGAGAQARTSDPTGTIKVLAVDGKRLCFSIDYADDLQTIDGVVSAKIP